MVLPDAKNFKSDGYFSIILDLESNLEPIRNRHSDPDQLQQIISDPGATGYRSGFTALSVLHRHRGGRTGNVNAWYLNTHMVYL